jgi:flagellar M-ring protein FliF
VATVPNDPNTTPPNTSLRFDQFSQLPNQKKLGLILAAAAVTTLLVGAWIWSQTPDYRVLYTNVSDKDGGAIINALQQMNVPYKFAEGGDTILVAGNQVHEARLRLAGQGLPKGGLVGFEVMENQKFGSSQFLEQVNYQRALEGEIARSVQSFSAVQSARVHLAIAKPSVFARERQQPSVSVLLNLYPGRVLSIDQVSAIVHLVSSSIPNLPVKNVTVVDQNGSLLTTQNSTKPDTGFDAKQLQYIQEIENSYTRRIESILAPITGANNVRAQVTADLDFSRIQRAEETYRPNNTESDAASIRSEQTSESTSTGSNIEGGIPGALTNRPPEPAIAPIEIPEEGGEEGEPNEDKEPLPTDHRKESTINYEVDKTIQHTHQSTGNIRRLSAAVVVNYRNNTDEEGNITQVPLSNEEIAEINNLVRQAMGFNEQRGDTLTVTNNLFTDDEIVQEIPFWKEPDTILLAKEIGKQLLIAAIVLFFLLKILRPFLKSLTQPPEPVPALPGSIPDDEEAIAIDNQPKKNSNYERDLQQAKQLATDEPAIVANVVKDWVSGNG